jgi:hypothetical protein
LGEVYLNLDDMVQQVYWSLSPIPLPIKFVIDDSVVTAAVNIGDYTVRASKKSIESPYWREFLAHEFKHASFDGLPYTLLNAKRHQAYLIRHLGVPPSVAGELLNSAYDIIVDTKLHSTGKFDIKGFQEYVVAFSPVTMIDSTWGKLNGLYRYFTGANVLGLTPPKYIVDHVKALVESTCPWKMDDGVFALAMYLRSDSRESREPSPSDRIDFNSIPEDLVPQVLECGIEAGLSEDILAEFLGEDGKIDAHLRNLARKKIWEQLLAFDSVFGNFSTTPIRMSAREKARYFTADLDPLYVSMHPDDPRKWKTVVKREFSQINVPGGQAGFEEAIVILDTSSSTADIYGNRMVLSYEKDIVAGLAAMCIRRKLKLTVIPFNSFYRVYTGKPVDVLARTLKLTPKGGTDIKSPAAELRNKSRCLVALVTDGEIEPTHMEAYTPHVGRNKIIAVVVTTLPANVKNVMMRGIKVYTVTPDSASNTIIREFTRFL